MRKSSTLHCGTTLRALAAGAMLVAGLQGCAAVPKDPAERAVYDQANDPLEPVNREIFDFNLFVDRNFLRPVAQAYVAVLPEQGRDAIRRVLDNMNEPVVFINKALQGDFDRAGITLGRFVVNTTAGLGGFFDVAKTAGLPKQNGDFGQTLFVYGVPDGPYLILPIFGPSNPRDGTGTVVDSYIDPFRFLATAEGITSLTISRAIVGGVDQRARVIDVLDDLQKNSIDFYAQLRSLSRQRRAADLRNGAVPEADSTLYLDPEKASQVPTPSAPALQPAPLTGKPDLRVPSAVISPEPINSAR